MLELIRVLFFSDQFIIDEKGYAKIVGRLKEMILRGGENIFPKEIEDFLQTHPNILEVQVGIFTELKWLITTKITLMSLNLRISISVVRWSD